jgi:hypothetical protein
MRSVNGMMISVCNRVAQTTFILFSTFLDLRLIGNFGMTASQHSTTARSCLLNGLLRWKSESSRKDACGDRGSTPAGDSRVRTGSLRKYYNNRGS